MLLWDVADKFKFPKRGFIIKSSTSSNPLKIETMQDSHIGVNYVRQKLASKNGFVAVSTSGDVVKLEIPPVINEALHKNVLSNPGSKIVWTPEAIAFMSNIGNNTGEVIATKTKAEKYLQENNSSGQNMITQVDVEIVINSKPEISLFYPTPVISECDPHFNSSFKVQFHPQHEYFRVYTATTT